MELIDFLIMMLSYLIGCFNTGYYFTRIVYQKDIRSVGTNVTGAMNVSRIAGKKGFFITFLGDALKGALIVLLCRFLGLSDTVTLISIFLVLAGHVFPFQLKFKGGKGLSTAFGAFLAFQPITIVYLAISCVVLFPFVRRYTITCLFAFVLLPLELFVSGYSLYICCFFLAFVLLIVWACRDNFREYFFHDAKT